MRFTVKKLSLIQVVVGAKMTIFNQPKFITFNEIITVKCVFFMQKPVGRSRLIKKISKLLIVILLTSLYQNHSLYQNSYRYHISNRISIDNITVIFK
jgi:hypothetical protein